jgi:hypothetical protein
MSDFSILVLAKIVCSRLVIGADCLIFHEFELLFEMAQINAFLIFINLDQNLFKSIAEAWLFE